MLHAQMRELVGGRGGRIYYMLSCTDCEPCEVGCTHQVGGWILLLQPVDRANS